MKVTLPLPASGITAAVALTATLTACGGTASQAAGALPSPSLLPVTSCETQNLLVVRDLNAARTSADGIYLPIDFVNESRAACWLRGYPRVFGLSSASQPPTKATNLAGHTVQVVLKPHYAAHTWVLIRHVSGHKEAGCTPFTSGGLRVFAPRSTAHAWITYPFTSCVTASQAVLSVQPIEQGFANPTIPP